MAGLHLRHSADSVEFRRDAQPQQRRLLNNIHPCSSTAYTASCAACSGASLNRQGSYSCWLPPFPPHRNPRPLHPVADALRRHAVYPRDLPERYPGHVVRQHRIVAAIPRPPVALSGSNEPRHRASQVGGNVHSHHGEFAHGFPRFGLGSIGNRRCASSRFSCAVVAALRFAKTRSRARFMLPSRC